MTPISAPCPRNRDSRRSIPPDPWNPGGRMSGILAIIAILLTCAVAGLIGWALIMELIYGRDDGPRLRASYDYDKETPPRGWGGRA